MSPYDDHPNDVKNQLARDADRAAYVAAGAAVLALVLTVLLLALGGCGRASAGQADASPAADAFTGTYQGSFNGQEAVLVLRREGSDVSGTVDGFAISGAVEGDVVRGPLKDPGSGAAGGRFEIARREDGLELRLTLRHPETGESLTVPPVLFTRADAPAVNTPAAVVSAAGVEHDPALVGRWRHTYAYASGGFSAAVDDWLVLDAGGACSTDSHAAGGTAAAGFESRGGDSPPGRWRTEGKVLYLSDGPGQDERAVGRYSVDGGRMMLTFNNGSRKVWERQ